MMITNVILFDIFCYAALHPRLATISSQVKVNHTGIIQVTDNATWWNICSHGWGQKEADITCKALGFTNGIPQVFNNQPVIGGTLFSINCDGFERTLGECVYWPMGSSHWCPMLAGVTCFNEGIVCFFYHATFML